jgi:hypothetical protein
MPRSHSQLASAWVRNIALFLLLSNLLPLALVVYGAMTVSESGLPACCRAHGKHHCMMSAAEREQLSNDEPAFSTPPERCPYRPSVLPSVHPSNGLMPTTGRMIYTGLISQPAVVWQDECRRRIARDRAHGKRGPPTSLFSKSNRS